MQLVFISLHEEMGTSGRKENKRCLFTKFLNDRIISAALHQALPFITQKPKSNNLYNSSTKLFNVKSRCSKKVTAWAVAKEDILMLIF